MYNNIISKTEYLNLIIKQKILNTDKDRIAELESKLKDIFTIIEAKDISDSFKVELIADRLK